MSDRFDPTIPGFIEGEFGDVKVIAPAAQFPPPALRRLVVDPTQDFTLEVQWTVYGAIVPVWMAALGGSWSVDVYAESMGGSPEIRIGGARVDVGTFTADALGRVNGRTYAAKVTVPGGTLLEHSSGTNDSGIYRLALSTFLNSSLGSPGFDVIGFSDGPLIQAEDPN